MQFTNLHAKKIPKNFLLQNLLSINSGHLRMMMKLMVCGDSLPSVMLLVVLLAYLLAHVRAGVLAMHGLAMVAMAAMVAMVAMAAISLSQTDRPLTATSSLIRENLSILSNIPNQNRWCDYQESSRSQIVREHLVSLCLFFLIVPCPTFYFEIFRFPFKFVLFFVLFFEKQFYIYNNQLKNK